VPLFETSKWPYIGLPDGRTKKEKDGQQTTHLAFASVLYSGCRVCMLKHERLMVELEGTMRDFISQPKI